MARTNSLTNFLTDVAAAIKEKLGSQTAIPASQFDSKIRDIQTVGTYQSKTINISANGSQTVEPDAQYDALSSVSITVAVPQLRLQTKSYEFTSNTVITLEPEQNYDGFSSISLTINVPGSQINNQDKNITANGTYTADQGYTGLGTVTVNVPQQGNAEAFVSKNAMDADTNKVINKIGIVYKEQYGYLTPGSSSNKFYLPKYLDIPQLEESVHLSLHSDDFDGTYPWMSMWDMNGDSSSVSVYGDIMIGQGSGMMFDFSYNYNSTLQKYVLNDEYLNYLPDGITYENEWLILPTNNKLLCSSSTAANNPLLQFLITSKHVLDGLYQANYVENVNQIKYCTNYTSGTFSYEIADIDNTGFLAAVNTIRPQSGYCGEFVFNYENDIMTSIDCYVRKTAGHLYLCILDNHIYVTTDSSNSSTAIQYYKHHYEISTGVLTTQEFSTTNLTTGTNTKQMLADITGKVHATIHTESTDSPIFGTWTGRSTTTVWVGTNNSDTSDCDTGYAKTALEYQPLDTQFTLSDDNQLYPNVVALGYDGEHTGDGGIWDTMPDEMFRGLLYNSDPANDSTLRSSLQAVNGISTLPTAKRMYGIDYDLSENASESYVYNNTILNIITSSISEPSSTWPNYNSRHIFAVNNNEIYMFSQSGSSLDRNLRVYKYHLGDDGYLVFDYTVTSSIPVYSYLECQPVCRYNNGIIYIVCASSASNASTAYPMLITFNTSSKAFTKVRQCGTSCLANGIIDFNVSTGICYFHNGSALYKWNTTGTSASNVVSDTFTTGYSSTCDGVVEFDNATYLAAMGTNAIHIVNRATGAVTNITDNSGNYTYNFSRGRFVEYDNYMYIIGYNYTSSTGRQYVAKINLSNMSFVNSVVTTTGSIRLRGKSDRSMFMFDDDHNNIYFITNNSYYTSSTGNNTAIFNRLNLDTLAITRMSTSVGSNAYIVDQFMTNTSLIIPQHYMTMLNIGEYNYAQSQKTFILCNITDFAHNDIPMIYYSSNTGYINITNRDKMLEYLRNSAAPDEVPPPVEDGDYSRDE